MTGTEIIRKMKHHYIVLSGDGNNMLVNPFSAEPLIFDSLPEAKDAACAIEGRWACLEEFVREFGN